MHDQVRYWSNYADELIRGLGATSGIKKFTKNPAVIGAQAESVVNKLIVQMVSPFKVSTGSIINPKLVEAEPGGRKHPLRQIDSIIWTPMPLPAIFEVENFALVPDRSVLGALEVKRSVYGSEMIENATETMDWVEKNVEGAIGNFPKSLLNKAQGHSGKYTLTDDEEKLMKDEMADKIWQSLLIVCLKEAGQRSSALDELVKEGRAVVLLEEVDGDFRSNKSHVLHLLDFLIRCRTRYENFLGTKVRAAEDWKSRVALSENETLPGSIWKQASGPKR